MKTNVHLQRDVLDELEWDPGLDAAEIGVTIHEGVVTLTGHLPVYAQKHAAEEAVKRVHGVRGVANEIEVRPTEMHVRDDEELAAAAVHALEWDARVPDANLQVVVENGWIRIEGTVEHPIQKEAADRAVRHLAGVRGILNEVSVESVAALEVAKDLIESAFRRSALLGSKELEVEIDDYCAIVTGDVHTHAELDEALRVVSTAPGVRRVRNCITVTPWGLGPAEEWGY
jgi:osmotically-inducible protein OsmY